MRKKQTLDPTYFETLYGQSADPWSFDTSPYEREKYARTLAALDGLSIGAALEVGCSIGVLTERLAARCRTLTATDVSATALAAAQKRCALLKNLEFRLVCSPLDNLQGRFELIVLSEVVYYWDKGDLEAFAEALGRSLPPGGRILLVHWLGETDYPWSGDDAVTTLQARLEWPITIEQAVRTEEYRLDLWRRS